jgi:uncharacterized Zn finger protein
MCTPLSWSDVDYYYDGNPYVSVTARRARAALELAELEKEGRRVSPVAVEGRKIASTFWGEAWCANLERYSDYANRLPRGRSYVRNGSVVDLQIAAGSVMALVSGSRMYEVRVSITPVSQACWKAVCRDCSGAIDSLVELLQGRFSDAVMTRLCEEKTGLFPSPQEILFTCSCPDWASMCKHVAAVLYGIGARLDHQPEMLFTLRKVDQQDLIAGAGSNLAKISKTKTPSAAKVLSDDNLAELFGIEIGPVNQSTPVADSVVATKPAKASSRKRQRKPTRRPDAVKAETAVPLSRKRMLTRAQRTAISVRVKSYWAARRRLGQKK